MKYLLIIIFLVMNNSIIIFDFDKQTNLKNWRVIDDVVMGGKSDGQIEINKDGHAQFSGTISLENNGGFSSIRTNLKTQNLSDLDFFKIRLKGDQKKYQFRVKSNSRNYYSYSYTFSTSGEWETIKIPFSEMKPVYRGRDLNRNYFSGEQIEEISILIGNKKPQKFKLEIDTIYAE